jgi:hypothetical protein
MRTLLPVILLVLAGPALRGQTAGGTPEGTVTYITSQNVYVKFASTAGFKTGDTLFILKGGQQVPALRIGEFSSISCVCTPLPGMTFAAGDKVYAASPRPQSPGSKPQATGGVPVVPAPVPSPMQTGIAGDSTHLAYPKTDTLEAGKVTKQDIRGYASVASYTNFSNTPADNNQRMRYTFSILAHDMGNTNLSAECYVTFVHSNQSGQWSEIQKDVFNGLKIYNLNLNYDFGTRASLLLGRKINPKLSNMGANDGLQFELKFKPVSIGVIAGFRPSLDDYGFNDTLFQAGVYLFNEYHSKKGYMQTTVAFVDQTSNWKTDRMFAYLQHVNALLKNLTFFGSVEVDLFGKSLIMPDSVYKTNYTPKLSNLYLSLSYRPWRKLTLSLSYSARQNVVYYESYKNFLDQFLDVQTLQGYLLMVNYRPVKNLTIGATGAYRFQKNDPKPTSNLYAYVTYSDIPGVHLAVTGSYMMLETSWTAGRIYSIGLSKDLFKGKLGLSANYRYVDYTFHTSESPLPQNVFEGDISWRIIRRLALMVYYEGTFEKINQFNRIYAQVNFSF